MVGRKAQIWVETVLYTLIGLALIGIILAIITPKINNTREKFVVEQSVGALNVFDERINEVLERGPGNKLSIPYFLIGEGKLSIDSSSNEIVFLINGFKSAYSELGVPIILGRVELISSEKNGRFSGRLSLNYSGVADIKYKKIDEDVKFNSARVPYSFSIENLGDKGLGIPSINIVETSRL